MLIIDIVTFSRTFTETVLPKDKSIVKVEPWVVIDCLSVAKTTDDAPTCLGLVSKQLQLQLRTLLKSSIKPLKSTSLQPNPSVIW